MKKLKQLVFAAALTFAVTAAQGAEIGHFGPGVPSIRDFAMPESRGSTRWSTTMATRPIG